MTAVMTTISTESPTLMAQAGKCTPSTTWMDRPMMYTSSLSHLAEGVTRKSSPLVIIAAKTPILITGLPMTWLAVNGGRWNQSHTNPGTSQFKTWEATAIPIAEHSWLRISRMGERSLIGETMKLAFIIGEFQACNLILQREECKTCSSNLIRLYTVIWLLPRFILLISTIQRWTSHHQCKRRSHAQVKK